MEMPEKPALTHVKQRHIAQVTVNSSGEEICNLFYSYPKDTAYANEIILAAKWQPILAASL